MARSQTACSVNDPSLVVSSTGANVFCGNSATGTNGQVYAYLGIPYAAVQPAAQNRFLPVTVAPLPVSQTGVAQTAYGAPCEQPTATVQGIMSEACLFLNIWIPKGQNAKNAPKVPVMVFIHGGAFIEGSGGSAAAVSSGVDNNLYDGTNFASQGVIVVTLNYRLGAFGFYGASFPNNGGTIPFSLGIQDQQAALRWVLANIGMFGGDTTRLTIFGESAGAMSVGLHTFSIPSNLTARGAMNSLPWWGALMESNPMGANYPQINTPSFSRIDAVDTAFLSSVCSQVNQLGRQPCSKAQMAAANSVAFLQSGQVTPAVILAAQTAASLAPGVFVATGAFNLPWTPVVDGSFITTEPYQGFPSTTTPIPMAFGVNQNEGAVFAGMALKQEGAKALAEAYQAELALTFGTNNLTTVEKYARYLPAAQLLPPPYATSSSVTLSNLITDYAMWCGNEFAMNQVLTQSKSGVFGYLFSEAPFSDVYNLGGKSIGTGGDNGACEPTQTNPNVCHAGELAYVFNTLPAITNTTLNYMPQPNDLKIAPLMNQAWVNFATNPASPGSYWTAYSPASSSGGAAVGQWVNGGYVTPSTSTINPTIAPILDSKNAHPMCNALWFTMPPFSGASASKKKK